MISDCNLADAILNQCEGCKMPSLYDDTNTNESYYEDYDEVDDYE